MKKLITLTVFLTLSLFGTTLSAQAYKSAIGVRLGYPWALTYKVFVNENSAIEVYGSYRGRTYRGYGYTYGYRELGVGATYQIHNDLSSVAEGLQWFYGGGGGIGFFTWTGDSAYYDSSSSMSVSIHGSIGLDYRFADVPVNLSVDWKPTFVLTGYGNGFGGKYGAVSVRYILGDN